MKFNELVIKDLIKSRVKNRADLSSFKRRVSKKYKIPCPSNIELLKAYHKLAENKTLLRQGYGGQGVKKKIEALLITRPVRSLSGIVNVSVLTKPYPCPGKCLYCPTEKGIPKSYLSGEPAVERAKRLRFNPYLQVKKRLEMLKSEGHPTDKVEIRIVGGTWSFYPKKYQNWFVKRCFDACNKRISKNLEIAQKLNEKAEQRIVGLSIETRPDFINPKEIGQLRKLGATMVELGVQSIFDDVLKLNRREHTIKATAFATKLLKDAGFKVLYQIMPNLPGSNLKRDGKMFGELFENPDFQPDLLKIYPCALLKEAPLYKLWKKRKYKPYTEKQLINLLKLIKKKIPYYVRIQRIQRDIPSQKILAGPAKISNLRQIAADLSKKQGWKCKCVRCREVKEDYDKKERVCFFRQDYLASDGREIFLSFENENRSKLYSLLRLRLPSYSKNNPTENGSPLAFPVLKDAAIIREVHTYGQLHPIAGKCPTSANSPQHRGLGKKLIKTAEKIVEKEFELKRLAAIAGVGTRVYWRKLGYKLKETYMVKNF